MPKRTAARPSVVTTSWPASHQASREREAPCVAWGLFLFLPPLAMNTPQPSPARRDDPGLSVTALYTAEVWRWGRLPGAELLRAPEGPWVFRITNGVLALARLFIWGMGSLRHSLLHRHLIFDHLAGELEPTQVFELAAGLSRRGVHLSADPSLRYVEVDLPPVLERKRALLEASPEGRAALARENLSLVEGDLAALDLAGALAPEATRRPGETLVIAEGLFMYLEATAQRALWSRVRELLEATGGGVFAFDLVPGPEEPKGGPIGRLLAWLMGRFTGGRGFARDARTRADLVAELKAQGFDQVQPLTPAQVAHPWCLPFPRRRTRQVIFCCALRPGALPASLPMS